MDDLQREPQYSKRVSLVAWMVGDVLGWAVMTGIGFTMWSVGEGVVALINDPDQTIPVAYTPGQMTRNSSDFWRSPRPAENRWRGIPKFAGLFRRSPVLCVN
jgi:hypothetical protein